LKNTVFDSYALLAYLFDAPGAETVSDCFKLALAGKKRIFLCTVNWSEIMYITIRAKGKNAWKTVQSHLLDLPIEMVDADRFLSEDAAEFKAAYKLSLADAYAAALAKVKNAELLTGDPEFTSIENSFNKIVWLKK
jgi:predicted nucleic acid-binding protein